MPAGWISKAMARLHAPEAKTPAVHLPAPERKALLQAVHQALMENDLEAARAKLEPLLPIDPKDREALAAAGIVAYLGGEHEVACGVLRQAVALDPLNGQARKFLAASLFKLGEDQAALQHAEEARRILPQDSQVVNMVAVLYINAERYDEAADLLHRALEMKPSDATPLINLAVLDGKGRVHRKTHDARPRTEQIRRQTLNRLLAAFKRSRLEPNDAKTLLALTSTSLAHFDTAVKVTDILFRSDTTLDDRVASLMADVYCRIGDVEKAIEMRELAVENAPRENGPKAALAQALIVAGDKRWRRAWEMADAEFPKLNRSAFVSEVPPWDGTRLGKQRLFVYQDQGAGDVLLSLRFLPILAARGIRVVLWVQPPIAELARTAPGYEAFSSSLERPDPRTLDCAAAAPLMGLVRLLRLEPRDLKKPVTVTPPAELCAAWRERLPRGEKPSIGLVATGNPWRQDDWIRSVAPDALRPLRACEGVRWVNLAVDPRPELGETIKMLDMADPTPGFRSFADTAAAIHQLDAVAAIDCSVAHIAAALGKPVWILAPSSIDWRWQIGADTKPWWPTASLLRCKAPGDWAHPVAALAAEIGRFVRERRSGV